MVRVDPDFFVILAESGELQVGVACICSASGKAHFALVVVHAVRTPLEDDVALAIPLVDQD